MKFISEFVFDQNKKLFWVVSVVWHEQILDMKLASFLGFLYKNEKEIGEKEADFCYFLVKLLKKAKFNSEEILAISDDWDMVYFIKRAIKDKINIIIGSVSFLVE